MNIKKLIKFLSKTPLILLVVFTPLFAQEDTAKEGDQKIKEELPVEERLDILAEELEKIKLKRATKKYSSVGGMGPAASEVYHVDEGFSFGGYGEVKFRDYRSKYKTDQLDVHRFILYTGYKFNDWILLNAEIEYEHAGFEESTVVSSVDFANSSSTTTTVNKGEVFVEFAYIDLLFSDAFSLAAGLQLVPVGITNLMHEPTTFYSVERPETESKIIPSTWREIGLLAHGELPGGFFYRSGILGGPRGSKFSDSTWIRGGRTKGSKSRAEDFAYVAALDFKGIEGLTLGTSYYKGFAGQGEIDKINWEDRIVNPISSLTDGTGLLAAYNEYTGNKNKSGRPAVNIAEAHYLLNLGPFETRGLFSRGWMKKEDARAINAKTGKNVGMVVEGGYIEVAFNLLYLAGVQSQRLMFFIRNEYVNTQKETVRKYPGGEDSIMDAVCVALHNTCKSTTDKALGIIAASDAGKEAYGVTGVADRTKDFRVVTVGLAYFPHPNVNIKVDYESRSSKSDYHKDVEWRNSSNNKIDRINIGVGFIF